MARLTPAWTSGTGGRHEFGDQGLDFRFEVTPLIVGGIMYHLDAHDADGAEPEGDDHRTPTGEPVK